MKKVNRKCLLLLCLMSLVNVVPCLGLLVPPAAGAVIWGVSTGYGALAVACGASGPVGWGLFGMITVWGA